MESKNIRNIALLGHGNSGKTSLAESMLFVTGAVDRLGKVSDGNTVCDYDAEEIKRQITIASSVAPVSFGGGKVNVLDCPGYFDFVGEVLCALRAVEAGVILCSAKDGISVGAERSWKYLKAANLPTAFVISKCDEEHGDYFAVVDALRAKYGSIVAPVTIPTSDGKGVIDLVHNVCYMTNGAKSTKGAVPAADAGHVEDLRMELMETAAGATEELMEKFFETMELEEADMVAGIRAGMKDRSVVPVFASSAMQNIGTEAFLQGVMDYVPAPIEMDGIDAQVAGIDAQQRQLDDQIHRTHVDAEFQTACGHDAFEFAHFELLLDLLAPPSRVHFIVQLRYASADVLFLRDELCIRMLSAEIIDPAFRRGKNVVVFAGNE